MERTEWRGQSKSQIEGKEIRSGKLVGGAAKTSNKLEEWHMLQRKNLSILGLLKKKRVASVPQREQLASCQSCLCQKEK